MQAFLYQGQLQPVAELDGNGAIVSRFVYATSVNVPDYMIKGGVTYRIVKDHLGSPRLVVDVATNTVAQEMDYDAFGNVILDTNPGFQPFGFAGGLYDRDTGLVRFGARDYDAETGRWTVKDPLLFKGSIGFFVYSRNNPITRKDPHGLFDIFGYGSYTHGLSTKLSTIFYILGLTPVPINEVENIGIIGIGSDHGIFAEHIIAQGIKLGGEQDYVAIFGGIASDTLGNEEDIILAEGGFGAELLFAGAGICSGSYELSTGSNKEKGVFFGLGGGAIGEHGSIGFGFSIPSLQELLDTIDVVGRAMHD